MVYPDSFSILDCTLRDGGYYTHWDFEDKLVDEYFDCMNQLPVECIEIGYRSKPRKEYHGAYFYLPEFILRKCRESTDKKLAVILNEKDVLSKDLEQLLAPCVGKIDIIRLAVAPNNLRRAIKLAAQIKEKEFLVSLNLMYASQWPANFPFREDLKNLNASVDYFYVVDSYGGMFPHQVSHIMDYLKEHVTIKLGFHGHNNLELALANSLAALESGAISIDCTIDGMGRGAGNLRTELLLSSLSAKCGLEVNYDYLSQIVSLFASMREKHKWGTNLAYMVSGSNSLPQQEVMSQLSKRFYSLNSIVRGVFNRSLGLEDNMDLKPLSVDNEFQNAIIVGGGPTGTTHSKAIKAFLKDNPQSCLIHASSKNAGAYKDVTGEQYHCLIGNEGRRLEKIFEDLRNSCKIAIIPPFPRTMGTYIPTALSDKAYQLKEIRFKGSLAESVTALAIETALRLQVKRIYCVGYDGYEGEVSAAEMDLFKENESIFNILNEAGVEISALTPSRYSRLKQDSVFAKL